jgi:ABC-type transporter Mla maintaining outer membrane lipid asymmetry ATPase subunit MlaF
VIAKIRQLKERRRLTVLMAEQNFNQAIKITDYACVMVHRRIEFEGQSAAELADNPMIKLLPARVDDRSAVSARPAVCQHPLPGGIEPLDSG